MKLSAKQCGLDTLERLAQPGIWDAFYYPLWQERTTGSLVAAFDAERGTADRFHVLHQCALLHVGVGTAQAGAEERIRASPELIRELLKERAGRVLGIARLNANEVPASLAALDTWVTRGPMLGICFPAGGQPGSLECSHANFDPLVRAAAAAGGFVLQMTRFETGEKDDTLLTTPAKLAVLAARHPDVAFICGHAGGDWEKGIRAVRSRPNIAVETSGFDSTSGFVEMAVRELGARRVIFGTHLPSRNIGTELAKVLGARISDEDKRLIFRENFLRLAGGLARKKGLLS